MLRIDPDKPHVGRAGKHPADPPRSYWIIDVGQDKPSLTVLELRRGKYAEAARVVGDEEFIAARPFPVTIVPAELL